MRNEHLIVLTGPLAGTSLPITGALSIGRNPGNSLQLEDLQISRKHAVIEQQEHATILRDLGSGNGTYIGNRRILEYKLTHGDVVRIGQQELRFEGDSQRKITETRAEKAEESGVRFLSKIEGKVESADARNLYATFFQAPQSSATEEQLRETQKRLQAVYLANQIIASERNLRKLFERVMDQIFSLVPAHNGVIMLRDKASGNLVTEYVKSGQKQEVTISSTIVNRAFEKGEAVITYDAADDARFDAGASIFSQNISSAMCAPLIHQDECLGVIYVDTRGTTNAFVSSDLELFVALAGPAAVALKNAQYLQQIEQAYNDTLIVLANAIELRDHYTVGHTWRVTNFSIEVARELGWSDVKLEEVQMGGVLHDVGKIAIDDAILRKPGKLTDEEYSKIKIHPEKGARLLEDVQFLQPLIPYCLYHHERFDGKGYPYGLSGDEIPLEGRVVAVADTFDALTSNRPYRQGFDAEKAMRIILEGRGTQFDPDCVDALQRAYQNGRIERILQDYHKKDEKSVACPFCSTFIQIPDGAEAGDEFGCDVCHRMVRLLFQNNAYFGELVPQTGSLHLTPRIPVEALE